MVSMCRVVIRLFDDNCGGYDEFTCSREFSDIHDAEHFIERLKHGEITAIVERSGRTITIDPNFLLDIFVEEK